MNIKKPSEQLLAPIEKASFLKVWDKSWTYIKTVVDVAHEPILILNQNLCVIAANQTFYKMFQVTESKTQGKLLYTLGNGQWDIVALKELLGSVLSHNTYFKGFEVNHIFPSIGRKVIFLNARQIYYQYDQKLKQVSPMILLAFEDVTEMMDVAELLTRHVNQFEVLRRN